MKNIIFLILSLLVITGCGKNEESQPPIQNPIPPYVPTMEDYYNRYCFGFKVKDTSNLTVMGCNTMAEASDTTYLSGVRNGKLWIGKFSTSLKGQLSDWSDSENINLSQKVHNGYGEYTSFTISKMRVVENIERKNSTLLIINTSGVVDYQTIGCTMMLFLQDGKSKKHIVPWCYSEKGIPWYNESYLAMVDISEEPYSCNGITCFDTNGDVIYHITGSNYLVEGKSFPLNYSDMICFSSSNMPPEYIKPAIRIIKTKIDSKSYDESIWENNFPYPKSHDYKFTTTLINKNGNIWTFELDFTELSGEKHSHKISIDIETGKSKEL